MFDPVTSPCLVPFDGSFRIEAAPTAPPRKAPGEKACREMLEQAVERLDELQRILYAYDRRAVLLVFQALDAAGKDGMIRAVLRGVDPAGCQVYSFKQPSAEELDHDFLWRCALRLPERGRIGVFNRSYYEEVLVVRVHPEFLAAQHLPQLPAAERLWEERFESIRGLEQHLARNGTLILKFWLNVSREEQRRRFLERIDQPDKNWKFAMRDVDESERWNDYQTAYAAALNATSRPCAPWYAIPADDKAFARATVAKIIVDSLERAGLRYPDPPPEVRARIEAMRARLRPE
jgi:PPK2 family polyphosphate:nucleotide phosphotransferase